MIVSTRSRPKAADLALSDFLLRLQSFNTQPPEGGCFSSVISKTLLAVSTRSRPKAAAGKTAMVVDMILFQHAAARRRLLNQV